MKDRYYIEMMKRAVEGNDTAMLRAIAGQLCDCEGAKRALRLKGYGKAGLSIEATAHLVPMAKGST